MALTQTEKQRRYRAALKRKREAAPDQAAPYLRRTFAQFLVDQGDDRGDPPHRDQIGAQLSEIGIELPDFAGEDEINHVSGEIFQGPNGLTGSIGKAELMAHAFRVSAQQLSQLINRYKLQEIEARLEEIERADLSDPVTKKKALNDVARLRELRRRLDKEVRHSFREIAVKGE